MKNVKKLFAVLLATTMLFATFAMPAFATMDYSTNTAPEGSFENYEEDELTAEGWVKLDIVSGRSIMYGVKITNPQQSQVGYDANIQCVATYDDGAFDADFDSSSVTIGTGKTGNVNSMVLLEYNKTIVSINAEFHVYSSGYAKWDGYIDVCYTPGINT